MHVQQIDFERVIVHVYAHNIVVALPVTILVIKLLVRFATREAAKDIFKSVLVVPLDLIYIAFGILLAGVAGRIPTFVAHYGSREDALVYGFVLGALLFMLACVITALDRSLRLLWQKFYAAWSVARSASGADNGAQMTLPGQPVNRLTTLAILWMLMYWSAMIPIVLAEWSLSLWALGAILKRIQ